jgi:hypothetical protein
MLEIMRMLKRYDAREIHRHLPAPDRCERPAWLYNSLTPQPVVFGSIGRPGRSSIHDPVGLGLMSAWPHTSGPSLVCQQPRQPPLDNRSVSIESEQLRAAHVWPECAAGQETGRVCRAPGSWPALGGGARLVAERSLSLRFRGATHDPGRFTPVGVVFCQRPSRSWRACRLFCVTSIGNQ